MSRFKFRFDALLDLRARQRDEAGADVGKASEAMDRIESQIADIDQQLRESRDAAASAIASASLSADRMLHQGRFDLQLQAEKQSLQQTLAQLAQELERRRGLLMQCEAEVKRLERLRESQQTQHRTEQARREQAVIDDQAAGRHRMNRIHRQSTEGSR